jgi:hypothetical protein
MISSDFAVATAFHSLATRESGAKARDAVLQALASHAVVTLDFEGAHPTPSFADELVGRLAESLGDHAFRTRVRIVGVGAAERPLLEQVISRRLQRQQDIAS